MNSNLKPQNLPMFLLHCDECGKWFRSEYDIEVCDDCLKESERILNERKFSR